MAIYPLEIAKPHGDEDWELWCKKIFTKIYKIPDFQRFKVRGSNQEGIDLLATGDDGKVIGVQCKRRSTERALTQKEADADLNRFLGFGIPLSVFAIASTHKLKRLQKWAASKCKPGFKVMFYAWGDIEDILRGDSALREELCGFAIAQDRKVVTRLRNLKKDSAAIRTATAAIEKAVVSGPKRKRDQFRESYRLAVQDYLDELDLFGVDLPTEARKYKLSAAYISLNLESGDGESESGPQQAESVFNRLSGGRLLIRGEAGCGKTTLLKWAAIQCHCAHVTYDGQALVFAWSHQEERERTKNRARITLGDAPFGNAVRWSLNSEGEVRVKCKVEDSCANDTLPWLTLTPFFIRLRDCTGGKLPPIGEFARSTAALKRSVPKDWEEDTLTNGMAMVLLDGIDEVPPKHRVSLHKQIRTLIRDFPQCMYVLTTRPLSEGEPEWLDELGFQRARVAPMSAVDRERCIDKWHEAVAEQLRLLNRSDPRLPAMPARLKAALRDAPEIARLATNPLLCAMICALHRSRNHLPSNLNELLEALTETLLYRRERETPDFNLTEFDPIYADLSYAQRKAIVSHLAKYMVQEGQSALPRAMVKKKVAEALSTIKDRDASHADVVLRGLIERSGMLREKSSDLIDFVHNTFKEYLAATRYLAAHEVQPLAEHADDENWENVLIFAAACAVDRPDFSETLIQKLLSPGEAVTKRGKKPTRRGRNKADVADDDAKQYRRSVMAIRVAAAIATSLDATTEQRIELLRKELFPPRNLSAAAGLATAGNAVLKFVSNSPNLKPAQRVRCIRTLRLIGTPDAAERLRAFRDDRTIAVIEELAQAMDPFEIPAVVECFTETAKSAEARGRRTLEDRQWRDGVRMAARQQITTCDALMGRAELVTIDLSATQATDAGLKELARQDTGLKNLTALDLSGTQVTDAGLKELARQDTGLKNLTSLNLWNTQVTDAGLKELARQDTGLKNLTSLNLMGTQVTDAGLKELARHDTGLKNLTALHLSGTQVTDAGLKELARQDTGLKNLTALDLWNTQVTDAGLKELARHDTGLKNLTALHLSGTQVTDAGLKELARQDTGLKNLTSLNLSDTQVTDAGLMAVKKSWPGIEIVR